MSLPAESPSPNDSNTIQFLRQLFTEARKEKKKLLPNWNRYYRLLRNRTWSDQRQGWMPSPQSSEIFPTIATLIAWLTDSRPRMFVSGNPDLDMFDLPIDDKTLAEFANLKAKDMEEVLDSWYVTAGIGTQLQTSLWDCFTFGTGILKTGYDPTRDRGLGAATLTRVDPYSLLPDPEASCFDDCRYVLEVRRVPLYEVRARFPERGHLVKADEEKASESDRRPRDKGNIEYVPMAQPAATGVTGVFPGTPTPGIPPLFGMPGQNNEDYTKTVLLIEAWVRGTNRITVPVIHEGERVDDMDVDAPYWQNIAMAGNLILTPDTDNPFHHAQLPYIRIPHVEIGEFWGVPLIEHLAPAQIALNRLLAAIQTNLELVGNPILLEDEDSGISRTKIINRPGGRLSKNRGSTIQWLEPPQMTTQALAAVEYWRNQIDRASGISAVARGSQSRRREPGAAVDAVQEASFVRIRAVLKNVESGLRQACQQVVSNVVQFEIEPRTVPRIGPQGNEEYLKLGHKHFYFTNVQMATDTNATKVEIVPLTFDVAIEGGSSTPMSRSAKTSEAQTLFFAGALDIPELLKSFNWPRWQEVADRVEGKIKGGQMPQGGRNPRKQGAKPR